MCVAVAGAADATPRSSSPAGGSSSRGGYRTQTDLAADSEAGKLERAVYGGNQPIDRLTAESGEAEARGSRSSSSRSPPSGGRSAMTPSGCTVPGHDRGRALDDHETGRLVSVAAAVRHSRDSRARIAADPGGFRRRAKAS